MLTDPIPHGLWRRLREPFITEREPAVALTYEEVIAKRAQAAEIFRQAGIYITENERAAI
jgi:hypothetical protein